MPDPTQFAQDVMDDYRQMISDLQQCVSELKRAGEEVIAAALDCVATPGKDSGTRLADAIGRWNIALRNSD